MYIYANIYYYIIVMCPICLGVVEATKTWLKSKCYHQSWQHSTHSTYHTDPCGPWAPKGKAHWKDLGQLSLLPSPEPPWSRSKSHKVTGTDWDSRRKTQLFLVRLGSLDLSHHRHLSLQASAGPEPNLGSTKLGFSSDTPVHLWSNGSLSFSQKGPSIPVKLANEC